MRLNTLIRRVEKAQGEVLACVKTACESPAVQRWIVSANQDQLSKGLNANGVLMNGGRYSPVAIKQRLSRGLPVNHVYLSFEGDLQRGMKVEYSQTGFAIVSTDWKERLVEEAMRTGYWPSSGYEAPEYGPVFGLTAANKGELSRMIRPIVGSKLRRRIMKG